MSHVDAKPDVIIKAQNNTHNITVNGKSYTLKTTVKIKDGVHIVRLKKELFTALGIKYLEWDKGDTIYVQLTHGTQRVVLEIQKGRKEIKVKSGKQYVKVTPSPTLEEHHVLVPLEPLYELLGFAIEGAPVTVTQKPELLKTEPEPPKTNITPPVETKELEITTPEVPAYVTPEETTQETEASKASFPTSFTQFPIPISWFPIPRTDGHRCIQAPDRPRS